MQSIMVVLIIMLANLALGYHNDDKPLSKSTCLITGGTSGIGYHTSLVLAEKGCFVIVAARDLKKADDINIELQKKHVDYNVKFIHLDLASLDSVYNFISWLEKNDIIIDILINNAGVFQRELITSKDNLESTFQINFISPLLLTEEIRKKQLISINGIIMNIISERLEVFNINEEKWLSFDGGIDWSKIMLPGDLAYAQSKLMLLMYSFWLKRQDESLRVIAFHPGAVSSKLYDAVPLHLGKMARLFMKKPERAAEEIYDILTAKIDNNKIVLGVKLKKEIIYFADTDYHQDKLICLTKDFLNAKLYGLEKLSIN